jgi:lysophospholipase L1-like esterase
MKTLNVLFALVFCIFLLNESSGQMKMTKIAFVGNSITEGSGLAQPKTQSYPGQLSNMLSADWQVGNFGVSGRTMLKKGDFPIWKEQKFKDALAFEPNIVVIMLGTNDSKYYNWAYKADFYKDYVSMIDTFAGLPSKPEIYICYPLKVFKKLWDIDDNVIRDEIIPIVTQISKDKNLKIIDCYTPTSDKPELFADGIHPNVAGAGFIAQLFFNTLSGKTYKKLFDENLLLRKGYKSSGIIGEGYVSNAAEKAIDGDLISAWSFKGFPATLTVDIGSIQAVDQFQLFFRSDKDKGLQYKIEASADSVLWTTVVDQTQRSNVVLAYSVDKIPSVDSRYIRLTFTGSSTGTQELIRINEFKALKYHGSFHAPLVYADISSLATALNLLPEQNMQNMSIWRYNTTSKNFDAINTIKDFTKPYTYKFTASVNRQYRYRTSAYLDGTDVFSDTISLKFGDLTNLAVIEKSTNDNFSVITSPSSNQIKLVAKQTINEKLSIKIYDINGQLLGTIPTPNSINTKDELIWSTNIKGSKNTVSGIVLINIEGQNIWENIKVSVNQ